MAFELREMNIVILFVALIIHHSRNAKSKRSFKN